MTDQPRPQDEDLALTLIGRTITDARWLDNGYDGSWGDCDHCLITLDDGRIIDLGAWGHDAWGLTMQEYDPAYPYDDDAYATP